MEIMDILIISFIFILFSTLSKKIIGSFVSAPIIFTLFGLLCSRDFLNIISINIDNNGLKIIGEITLTLILFTDSARINLSSLKTRHTIAIRLLTINLLLIFFLGTAVGRFIFPGIPLVSIALIAAILTPTDAALYNSIFTNKEIPIRTRQSLNVESGLNDGLALPLIIILISLSKASSFSYFFFTWIAFKQLFLSIVIGSIIGFSMGLLYKKAKRKKWINITFAKVLTIAIALFTFSFSEYFGLSGFLATYVCGIIIGNTSKTIVKPICDFAGTEGQMLNLLVFFLFGLVLVPAVLKNLTLPIALYSIMTIFVIRIISVFISLIKTKITWQSKLFIGWFGPKGLASIIFALLIMDEKLINSNLIFTSSIFTVFISILFYGLLGHVIEKKYQKAMKNKHSYEHKKTNEHPIKYIHN